jgi:hypothetical protein
LTNFSFNTQWLHYFISPTSHRKGVIAMPVAKKKAAAKKPAKKTAKKKKK